MINSISIKNFQVHKNSILKFSPGINIICGLSNEGKTSIKRALTWVFNNSPSGAKLLNRKLKTGKIEVDVYLDNNKVEIKRKSKVLPKSKRDKYILKTEDSEQEYSSFGSSVPVEIQNILNIDEVNIQNQLDNEFLISSSNGEISRQISNTIGISEVDDWIKKLNRKIRTNSRDFQDYDLEEKKIKDNLKALKLKPIDLLIKRISSSDKKKELIGEAIRLIGEIDTEQETINLKKDSFLIGKYIRDIEKLDEEAEKIITAINLIEEIEYSENILGVSENCDSLKVFIEELEALNTSENNLSEAFSVKTKLKKLQIKSKINVSGIKKLISKIEKIDIENIIQAIKTIVDIDLASMKIEALELVWNEVDKELKSDLDSIGYCPLCERSN